MSEIFNVLAQNPAYAAGAVLLVIMVAFSIFKKLLKMAIISGVLFFGYCYYLHSQGKGLPSAADAERVLQQGKAMTSKLETEAHSIQQQAQQASKAAADAKAKVESAASKVGTR